jgi:FlaA1/EpsC-like NDP-sugar epimerase
LILLEAVESNLYQLQREWGEASANNSACAMTAVLGGMGDRGLLEEIFSVYTPDLVFHTAAFKHVPLMEEQPLAAIRNNIFATETLLDVAQKYGARVMQLSTDKAVAPASVMGATKRVAEQMVLAAGGRALRLANVLASRDSVAEVFARQIAAGGPLTVTTPTAQRYFITLEEAVNLLLTAATLPEPVALLAPVLPGTQRIAELARFMADELAPGREIGLKFSGVRVGDKESEELWGTAERSRATSCAGLVTIETEKLKAAELEALRRAMETRDLIGALKSLRRLVPDYKPSEAVLALAESHAREICR